MQLYFTCHLTYKSINWSVKKYESVLLLSILDGSSNRVEIRGLVRLER